MKNRITALALMLAVTCAHARAPLPADVAAALRAAEVPTSAVSVVVQEVGAPGNAGKVIELNATQTMNPASVMKLVTTWSALGMLGPGFTWKTRAYAQGPLADGVLNGDLVIEGGGDPKFTQEQFWLLLRQVRARGVRHIRGNLVLDRSAFAAVTADPTFDDTPLRAYNVTPDALLLNFKTTRLTLVPQSPGQALALRAEPPLTELGVVNLTRTSDGPCGEWKDTLFADQIQQDGRYFLSLAGEYPAACGEQNWNLGLMPHREYIGAVFRDLWRELGGTLDGDVRDAVTGSAPTEVQPLAVIESPTLGEIVRDINKHSNNVMARMLFLTLARTTYPDRPATTQEAATALHAWLDTQGITAPELVLDNGSGLSRRERLSAASLARLLQAAAKSPLMPELAASLPLAAVDGTMKKRLNGENVAGHAHIKTGTLDGVKTMAGYVQDARGRNMIVVFFVNHPNARRTQEAQDALLRWVYANRK